MRVIEIRIKDGKEIRYVLRKGMTNEMASKVRACRQKVNKLKDRDWKVEVEDEPVHRTRKTPWVERTDRQESSE